MNQTITLAGFVWEYYGAIFANTNRKGLLMLGNVKRADALESPQLMTHSIWISPLTQLTPDLTEPGAHIVVSATIADGPGALQVMEATTIEPFDGRETDDWRRYY